MLAPVPGARPTAQAIVDRTGEPSDTSSVAVLQRALMEEKVRTASLQTRLERAEGGSAPGHAHAPSTATAGSPGRRRLMRASTSLY